MKIIAYYRVSTRRQGESGLGLEGQKAAVAAFSDGRTGQILAEYTEVESGRKSSRPELLRALAHARRSRATLVIAKLDRLARNVAFVSALMESSVDFVACDNPHANKLTIHILAAVAEDEADRISQRTRDALEAYVARGGKLGCHDPRCRPISREASEKGQRAAAKVSRKLAAAAYHDLLPSIQTLRADGASFREIALQLNELGHTTRTGKPWNPTQVHRVFKRAS